MCGKQGWVSHAEEGLQGVGDHQAEPVLVNDGDAVHELAVPYRAGRGIPLHLPPAIAINRLIQGAMETFWAAVCHQCCQPVSASCSAQGNIIGERLYVQGQMVLKLEEVGQVCKRYVPRRGLHSNGHKQVSLPLAKMTGTASWKKLSWLESHVCNKSATACC